MDKEAFDAAKTYWKVYDDRSLDEALDLGFREKGYRGAMTRGAEALVARFQKSYANPYDIATFYLAAGEKSKALDWLEKGYAVRDLDMPYIGSPVFEGLRDDPRYKALLRKMNLSAS